ncbi:hypothetical protein ThrDRAFT_04604 [Frankia casuarinae]|jgi:hypothetical protein|nr:hypothetical protein CcI6DRAFT_01183 [Frankia sp. CcI6]EYT89779.1 hypothetical protein ThrDRAFT_04604 [Frankia casuarinae]KDA40973.1 hypothetical protein BMG523Draft_04217 [Frankia sp. BMG5.23]KEZ34507.1 hypothetical protein CEDDRAFT_04132 [Frankia sp. CeD]KFB03620.1 hypothetical protein ALLO2DRAFT_03662 [Frankia sp. Allo2]
MIALVTTVRQRAWSVCCSGPESRYPQGRYPLLQPTGAGETIFTYEFATVEWLWDQGSIRVNMPRGKERMFPGSYDELVTVLSDLGGQGWDVATCAATGNWLFWTLRRQR